MKEITLTRRQVTVVDDGDYDELIKYKWFAIKPIGSHTTYAARDIGHGIVFMHRQILDTPKGVGTDHKDGDGLNNRRDNIRPCTQAQNMANRGKHAINTTSRYKGVYYNKQRRKWRARLKIHRKFIELGFFDVEADAAEAYNRAAIAHFGEFARPNVL